MSTLEELQARAEKIGMYVEPEGDTYLLGNDTDALVCHSLEIVEKALAAWFECDDEEFARRLGA